VVVEIKAVNTITPGHQAQLITFLKLSRKQVSLLINFRCRTFEGWDSTMVCGEPPSVSSVSSVVKSLVST
jgi:hypothetical protein